MGDVHFIQYLRPHGERTLISIDRPHDIYAKAEEIRGAGYVFECEHLTTGHVSFTIIKADGTSEQDEAIKICMNGPDVPETVDNLINDFHAHLRRTR
jgi:hypothetical protein